MNTTENLFINFCRRPRYVGKNEEPACDQFFSFKLSQAESSHRHRRYGRSTAFKIPECPRTRIENARRRVIEYFAILGQAYAGFFEPKQILGGSITHRVSQKTDRVCHGFLRLLEPDDPSCHGDQFGGRLKRFQNDSPSVKSGSIGLKIGNLPRSTARAAFVRRSLTSSANLGTSA